MTVEREKRAFPSRREFISLGIGAFVVGTIPFATRGRKQLVRRTLPVMGTFGEIAIVHKDEKYAQGAIDAAFQEIQRVESTLTWFRPDSEIGRVNLGAYGTPQIVSGETSSVLRSALGWADASQGAFDPCLGQAVSLWDFQNRSAPPRDADVRRFADEKDRRDRRAVLDKFLREQQDLANKLSDALARKYFSHVLPVRSRGSGSTSAAKTSRHSSSVAWAAAVLGAGSARFAIRTSSGLVPRRARSEWSGTSFGHQSMPCVRSRQSTEKAPPKNPNVRPPRAIRAPRGM